jgi:hypothetical protein
MTRRRFLFDQVESLRPEAALRAHSKLLHILNADASRLATLRKLGISRYSCVFAPCQASASTPKIVNLFFREPQRLTEIEVDAH